MSPADPSGPRRQQADFLTQMSENLDAGRIDLPAFPQNSGADLVAQSTADSGNENDTVLQ